MNLFHLTFKPFRSPEVISFCSTRVLAALGFFFNSKLMFYSGPNLPQPGGRKDVPDRRRYLVRSTYSSGGHGGVRLLRSAIDGPFVEVVFVRRISNFIYSLKAIKPFCKFNQWHYSLFLSLIHSFFTYSIILSFFFHQFIFFHSIILLPLIN